MPMICPEGSMIVRVKFQFTGMYSAGQSQIKHLFARYFVFDILFMCQCNP